MRYPTYEIFVTAFLSLALSTILAPVWINFLRSKNIGEEVRIDGPLEHLLKQGTPTMGGVLILFAFTISFLLRAEINLSNLSTVALVTTLSCGLLGFADDYSKIAKERSLGLRARTKFFWQFVISLVIGWMAINYSHVPTTLQIPLTNYAIDLGVGYYLLVFLIIASTTNGVNLTDGLDGLAVGTVAVVMLAYAGIAFKLGYLDLAIFAAAIGGSCIGFLWYNSFPAEIFMGDTGALGLGGAIAALAILTKTEILLILIGGIYVLETLSVIAQVVSYRFFGHRVLNMAPIHHHFELLGWSETKVMIRFWVIAGVFAAAGFAIFFIGSVRGIQ
jgi:phospho-N-acetylmuramoyl-pentapeptide-transferase